MLHCSLNTKYDINNTHADDSDDDDDDDDDDDGTTRGYNTDLATKIIKLSAL